MTEKINFLPPEDLQPRFVFASLSETQDWGLVAAGIPLAHQHTRGAGVRVAVLDTGGPNHLDLNDNLLPAIDCSGSGDPTDHQGHGTHVAGVIGALSNGIGILGVAPEVKIIPIKVLDDYGQSGFQQIEDGIRAAIAAGADIINMSLGATVPPPDTLHAAIIEAANKGIIIIAAAGNDAGNVNFPAIYPEVIAVAAVDKEGNLASFSSRGDKVAVAAPGVNIYSTYLANQYAVLNGTSQASPFICGVCALILAWTRANPSVPQITGVKDMLNRLDDMTSTPVGTIGFLGPHQGLGFGIPRMFNMAWDKV